jgi:hypothetical protein
MNITKLIKIAVIFLAFITCANTADTAKQPEVVQNESSIALNDITIVIPSCDKYADLWDGFFTQLFKHWPSLLTKNKHIPILFVTNKKAYTNPRVTNIQIPNEQSWSDNAIELMKHVKTKYIYILLEDYFITKFNEKRFAEIVNAIQKDNVSYVQIDSPHEIEPKRNPYAKLDGVFEKHKHEDFRTSLKSCIWKSEDFLHILRTKESAWDFESPGSVRSQGLKGKFLIVMNDMPLECLNMAHIGYLDSASLAAAEKLGIHLKSNSLERDSDHRIKIWFKQKLPGILYFDIIVPLKKLFKSIFS